MSVTGLSAMEKNQSKETGSAWPRNSAVFIKRDRRRSQRAETSWGLRPDRGRGRSLVDSGKKRQEVQRPTGGSAAAHRRKCAECPRTATEAVWLSRERRRKRRPWDGRRGEGGVTRAGWPGASAGLWLLLWLRCRINGGLMRWTALPRGFPSSSQIFQMYQQL